MAHFLGASDELGLCPEVTCTYKTWGGGEYAMGDSETNHNTKIK